MKKIYLLIFTLFLFLSCYIVYCLTDIKVDFYLSIGDKSYYNDSDSTFIDNDYRIIDLLNVLKYNQEMIINDKPVSIHQLLNKTDYLFISIGRNDLNYILNSNSKQKYRYINKAVNNLKNIFDIVSNYSFKKVYFIGFNCEDNTVCNYTNYLVKKICKKYNFDFIYYDNSTIWGKYM